MAKYDFITLDVNRKDPLFKHLIEVCGIQPEDKATINDLQDAILAFEENNGYERPLDLLPERLKPEAPIVSAQTEAKPTNVYVPIGKRNRRLVVVENSMGDLKQEYFQINEYKVLIKFGEEIELPEPMIDHIKNVKVTQYKQEKDGEISSVVKRCYSVIEG